MVMSITTYERPQHQRIADALSTKRAKKRMLHVPLYVLLSMTVQSSTSIIAWRQD